MPHTWRASDPARGAKLPATPLLLPGNLSCSTADSIAYVRGDAAWIVRRAFSDRAGAPKAKQLPAASTGTPLAAAFVLLSGAEYIAVATTAGVQLWDDAGAAMLHFWRLRASISNVDGKSFHLYTCLRTN